MRLIEAHGIECIAAILDKACKDPRGNDSRNLIAAVKEVTGEDVEQRFLRYQTFRTAGEGLAQYAKRHNAALARKDYAAALPLLLRIQELVCRGDRKEYLRYYAHAAFLLFRMGHQAAADRAILWRADLSKTSGRQRAHVALHMLFIDYARVCGNLAKAVPSAELVLQSKPDFVPALAVLMLKHGTDRQYAAAARIAQRIRDSTDDPNDPWRKMAEKVLTAARKSSDRPAAK